MHQLILYDYKFIKKRSFGLPYGEQTFLKMYQCLEFGPCSCYFNNKYFSNVYDAYQKTHTFISNRYMYGEGHCFDVIKLTGAKEDYVNLKT